MRGRPRVPSAGGRRCGRSGFDLVMTPSHHRLVQLEPCRGEDREQGLPERLKRLLGLPDVEDLNLAACLQGDVEDSSVGGACARFFELSEGCVVLLLSESFASDVEPKCHSVVDSLRAVCAVACPAIAPLYVTDRERRIFSQR